MRRKRRNRRNSQSDLVFGIVSSAALAVVVVGALLHIKDLDEEIDGYIEQLGVMAERGGQAELRNRELSEDIFKLLESLKALEEESGELAGITEELEIITDELENENYELAAVLGELERLNGELTKKFDGLSKPN